jgi:hypothetical protein
LIVITEFVCSSLFPPGTYINKTINEATECSFTCYFQSVFHDNCNIRNYMCCTVKNCSLYKLHFSQGHVACRATCRQLNKCYLTLRKSSLEYAHIITKFQGTTFWKWTVNYTLNYEITQIPVLSTYAHYFLVCHKLHELIKSLSSLTSISQRNTEESKVK